ncbi:DUF2236 domain-containing protein [Rathayibacter sp. AY1E4]|jgi:uncharacterized protein (DUF2236 family)|uniref:oxygenase MpaB family protein n=1 Tax=unclassified Rathayibacter TaxID=2609250 RepID=UPI000CE7B1A4|nr:MULTISPECIES: oxygenase MpaB family protein [unclassified Rathayibacter]PPG57836.1 DUF2236 domain-containing protein [Rathayibacter sp. AY1C5]PPG65212.1 DUF2236 domain-containing protein [Rathayibacter sp. AY2B7]PPH16081.1 DUF2236 domain-containing protein [Rathayibacter sp. AY1F8]PPH40711.1 DUF2236 domain-containing protein [Rathayibacter sp. AY1E4]PPH75023.1 DUF2236 domain-containing protein [Rathayibacter sp. AY1D4]
MRRRRPRPRADWIVALEKGDDAGLFGPGSAVWAVNGGLPTMIAGVRALLMQTLHAGAMAGVHDHSRYREDPMGRLDNTVRWVLTTSFGDTAAASGAARWVTGVHERIVGSYEDAGGRERSYSAQDPRLLLWVHDAFTDAFLGAHEIWGGRIPGGPDAYVREWAASGRLLGVEDPPESVAELRAQLAGFAGELKPDARVHEAVGFLRDIRLPGEAGVVYPLLFAGAVASLSPEVRRLLGLRRPWWPAITANRLLFVFLGRYLGRVSPSEQAAIDRIAGLDQVRTGA